jgi:acyl dehydratase
MSVDPEALSNWPVPEQTHAVSRRDVAFYALSVGLGHDPLDADQLAFVDPDAPQLRALPSMALVLAYPGFWLGDPATGVNAAKVVHAEQSIELFGELPVEGTLIGRTTVTGLIDRGAEKGSILHSQREILRADGSLCALLKQTHMLRGDGGFGGEQPEKAKPVAMPAGEPLRSLRLATRPEQALIYRLNGDTNPLHIYPETAARAGFPRPLLHGMCTFGVVAHALLKLACDYDVTRFRSMSARFSSPVYPGETIQTELHAGGLFRARVVERDQVVVDNGILVLNEA